MNPFKRPLQQLSLSSLLSLMLFIPIFTAALAGAFGARIEQTVYEFSLFITVVLIWTLFQVVLYATIISPLVVLWFVVNNRRA